MLPLIRLGGHIVYWGDMKKAILLVLITTSIPFSARAATISLSPQDIYQGDAVLATFNIPLSQLDSVAMNGTSIPSFAYGTSSAAFIGIGLSAATGTRTVTIATKSGESTSATFTIVARSRPTESMPIPARMGGNSVSNQLHFVSKLAQENAILANLTTNKETLWTKPFIAPVPKPVLTDPYGYSRDSGAAVITHKGADFKAPIGTSVAAMNSGVVRLSRYSPVYGNTVVIDHGQGVMTMYMHLSKRSVTRGQSVKQGQKIGLSGDTGYSEGAHLHITVRINGESIDPIEFLGLFGVSVS